MPFWCLGLALVLTSCGDKSASTTSGDRAGSALVAAGTTGSGTGSANIATVAAGSAASGSNRTDGTGLSGTPSNRPTGLNPQIDICQYPYALLAEVSLADAPAAYQARCQQGWPGPSATECDLLDQARNTIYAAHGYAFKKEKWRALFGATPWYKARVDFKDSDMSKPALANVRALKQSARSCRSGGLPPIPTTFSASTLSAADQTAVVAWFTARRQGNPHLPAYLADGLTPLSPAQFRSWLDTPGLFALNPWTPMDYETTDGVAGPGPKGTTKIVRIGTSAPDPKIDCESEECEGFESLYMFLNDRSEIVGLAFFAAG